MPIAKGRRHLFINVDHIWYRIHRTFTIFMREFTWFKFGQFYLILTLTIGEDLYLACMHAWNLCVEISNALILVQIWCLSILARSSEVLTMDNSWLASYCQICFNLGHSELVINGIHIWHAYFLWQDFTNFNTEQHIPQFQCHHFSTACALAILSIGRQWMDFQ